MAMDPDFFTARLNEKQNPARALASARQALLAAVAAALASPSRQRPFAAAALRLLRNACFDAPKGSLVDLQFPLDADGMIETMALPCRRWLPLAEELGVADMRLLLLGLPTTACRDIRDRFG